MSSILETDQHLLQLLNAANITTIDGVIRTMESVDRLLPDSDGLKWFNRLYLLVTNEVKANPSLSPWKNEPWLTHLDMKFAAFYFTAIRKALTQVHDVPKSWQALFESRHLAGIERVQFALAGMNAHINHDLALALTEVDADFHLTPSLSSPEHDDYERVNLFLEEVVPSALEFLATGIIGLIAESTGHLGQLLAIWNIRKARDLAWEFSGHLRILPGFAKNSALSIQDKLTGALGHSLLRPMK
jgi:hypothetical protein